VDEKVKKNQANKPFKQTKQLINLALKDGWTQKNIAEQCRTQQSIVSKWSNGGAFAKEYQVQPLPEQYGHILRRKTFKVYWVVDEDTQETSYVKIEGKVVFSYVLRNVEYYNNRRNKKVTPVARIVVHHQGKEKFRVVHQSPFKSHNQEFSTCMDEDANWLSTIREQESSEGIIQWIDGCANNDSLDLPPDAKALSFLIRKALLNHGFTVEDVVDYPASW
jgi:hypothetical protein